MTLQELNNNLTQLLKKEIRNKKHVKSGKLLGNKLKQTPTNLYKLNK